MQNTAPNVEEIATRFFDFYRVHDVQGMVSLFAEEGTVEYVPFKMKGSVHEVGVSSWNNLISAFPDLTNCIDRLYSDKSGRVAFVDMHLAGTQTKQVFDIPNQGKHYDLRHLFIIEVNSNSKITSVIAFWDSVDWYQQLGKTTLN